jgi:Leucine-rich repeat (LRR) protein
MNSSPPTDRFTAKKRRMRKVLVFPGIDEYGWTDTVFDIEAIIPIFAIDEEDYLVVCEMLSMNGVSDDQIFTYVRKIVEIREDDEDRRVYKLLIARHISSFPPSIGRLQDLEEIGFSPTFFDQRTDLTTLPEWICDLTSLTKLDLSHSGIQSLPPSIGRLQNIECLNLCYTDCLSNLPDEIGDMTTLIILDLCSSKIKSLPPSIGRLQNLEYLDLRYTHSLSNLPEEIGNLNNLKELNLQYSGIKWLPDSIGRLKGLLYLNIYRTTIPELQGEDQDEFLMTLVQRHPLLVSLGKLTVGGRENLNHSLACNRARLHTGFGITDDNNSIRTTPKLWPLMLKHATRAFNKYPTISDLDGDYYLKYSIEEPDAIYQFLVNGRESFIGALLDRNN